MKEYFKALGLAWVLVSAIVMLVLGIYTMDKDFTVGLILFIISVFICIVILFYIFFMVFCNKD